MAKAAKSETANNHDMYDKYVELRVEGLTRGRELSNAYILVLGSENHDAFYPISLSHEGYKKIHAALNDHDFTCSHLMHRLANRVGMSMTGIRVMQPHNGDTNAMIDFELINEIVSFSAPIAEATVAAIETKSPIYVQRALFERQNNLPHTNENMAIPITSMNNSLLSQALESAVKEDNFELAILLRGELQRRKAQDGTNGNDI